MAKPEVCNEKAITEGDFHGFFIVAGTYVNRNELMYGNASVLFLCFIKKKNSDRIEGNV
ncbi:MAG: hypothetical protein ACI4EI_01535 [Muricoprocola sp.]